MIELETFFGAGIACATSTWDDHAADLLWPEEQAALGRVGWRRRRDFVAGRTCARRCMESLGHEPAPVLIGADREPVWPPGLLGSITHTEAFAAAALARTGDYLSIGIDAEPDAPLPDGVLERVANSAERAWVASVDPAALRHPGCLLFCAKEATYKAWYPLTRRWLGFEEAAVSVDVESERFAVEISVDGPVRHFDGRFRSHQGVIVAAIEVRPGMDS